MRRAVVMVLALLFLIDLGVDLFNTRSYGGIDLRDKVVAGRLLVAGVSPYTYHWHPGDPEQWLDPNADPSAPLSRYTGTPGQTLLFAAIGGLPFGGIRMGWTLVQYLLGIGAVLLLSRSTGRNDRLLLWGAAIILVVSAAPWHLHVERGQVYVLFAGLLALALSLASGEGSRRAMLTVGVLIAVLTVLKPPLVVVGLPFLLARRWPVVIGASGTAGLLLALFAATGMIHDWRDYSVAMRQWATASFDTRTGPPPADQPLVVEGMSTLRSHRQFEVEDGSVRAIASTWTGAQLSPSVCTLLAAVALIAVMGAFAGRYARLNPVDLLLLGFAAGILTLACLPAPRFTYQQVLWLGPLLVIIRDRRQNAPLGLAMVVGGALTGLRLFAFVPQSYIVGEAVMIAGLLLILWRRPSPQVTPRTGTMAQPSPAPYTL